jgi:amino acid adenylation domain-containing protein
MTSLLSTQTINGLVAAQVTATPDAVALTHGQRELSYRQFARTANNWANRLVDWGLRPGDVVGLLMDRSATFAAAALAVLTAGGAYLPLDRRRPVDRLHWMVRDAGAVLVLTDRFAADADCVAGRPVLDTRWLGPDRQTRASAPDVPVHPDQLAYVMYTSGSTGRPKAIATTHRNVVDFVCDPCWNSGRHERVLAYSPLDFDSSTYELWVPLTHGGRSVVWSADRFDVTEMRAVITRHGVTAGYFTTALFDTVAHEDVTALTSLREIITGGDVLSPATLSGVLERCPNTTVVHAYGPTETTVFCSLQTFNPGPNASPRLHLGTPMNHTTMYVLDPGLQPAPPGVVGELFVAGTHLATGYLHQPGLTAQRFLPDPYGRPGERMYRTGDLARRAADGTITFSGRADRQIKLRGFRVEPGEIEAVLADDPAVRQAVVTVHDDLPGGRGLIGYVVPTAGFDERLDIEQVRRRAASALPDYMLPAAFVVLNELPLNGNGKIDLAALPRLEPASHASTPARTALEETLCSLFTDVLQCPPVGVRDNFFQLGGHSLLAIRLCGRIGTATGHPVTVRELFEHPTVAGLASHLAGSSGKG